VLGYNALQVHLTHALKQSDAFSLDVIGISHSWCGQSSEDPPQFALSIYQWLRPQVFAVAHQEIESKETRFTSMEKQIAELWSALFVNADDFSIKHCLARMQRDAQIEWEGVTVAGDEFSFARFGWRRVSGIRSYFSSKIHSGWSKGRGLRDNSMGWNAIGGEDTKPVSENGAKAAWRAADHAPWATSTAIHALKPAKARPSSRDKPGPMSPGTRQFRVRGTHWRN
jgi:hypothetical protein